MNRPFSISWLPTLYISISGEWYVEASPTYLPPCLEVTYLTMAGYYICCVYTVSADYIKHTSRQSLSSSVFEFEISSVSKLETVILFFFQLPFSSGSLYHRSLETFNQCLV